MPQIKNIADPARIVGIGGFRMKPDETIDFTDKNKSGQTLEDLLKVTAQRDYARALVKSGAIEVVDDDGHVLTEPAKKSGKRPASKKKTESPLADLSEEDAIAALESETDPELLSEWFALETRPAVKKAINARAASLK